MKKKLIITILLTLAATFILGGCSKSKYKQTKDEMTMEAGSTFELDINEFFKASKKAIDEKAYTVDATLVDSTKIGTYDVTVTFGEKDTKSAETFTIKVNVEDTTKPEVVLKTKDGAEADYFYINDLDENLNVADYIEVKDITSTKTSITYEKLGNVSAITDEALTKYAKFEKDAEISEEKDGFYKATIHVTDEGGNTASVDTLVICDATAPSVLYKGAEVTDGASVEATDVENAKKNFTATDNFAGNLASEDMLFTYDEAGKTLTVTAMDRAANKTELKVGVTIKTANAGTSNSTGSTSNSGNKNNGGSTTPSQGGVQTSQTPVSSDPILNKYPGLTASKYVYLDGSPSYSGKIKLDNGYTIPIEDASEKWIAYWVDCGNHINSVYVDTNDYWTVWAVCPDEDYLGDSDAIRDEIATKYVQSIYGPEYTAVVPNRHCPYAVYSPSGKAVSGSFGQDIRVLCPDGVWRVLETDNTIRNRNDASVWKTPSDVN